MIQLEQQIQDMIKYIRKLIPEVRVKETNVIYEDENANLKVYPPLTWNEEDCLTLQEKISEHSIDILIDTGYLILIYVYMPAQQIALTRHKLAIAQQQEVEANRFLAQAVTLGMT